MHGASTLTQQLARKLFLTDDKTPERKIKEALARDPDREALHEARDLHALLQPDVLRPRRIRRRSGVAAVLRQVREGRLARGGRAHRRHPAGKRAAEPVREHGSGAAPAQLRAGPDGRSRLHHAGGGRGGEEEAHRRPRRAGRTQTSSAAPYFLEEVRRELESRYGAKQLYENGLSIQTAIDLRLQEAATRALDDGLRRIDKRRGFRKPRRNVVDRRPHDRSVPQPALGATDAGGPGRARGRRRR